jgi:hypothetical protein
MTWVFWKRHSAYVQVRIRTRHLHNLLVQPIVERYGEPTKDVSCMVLLPDLRGPSISKDMREASGESRITDACFCCRIPCLCVYLIIKCTASVSTNSNRCSATSLLQFPLLYRRAIADMATQSHVLGPLHVKYYMYISSYFSRRSFLRQTRKE